MTLIEEQDADVRTGWIRTAIGFGQGFIAWALIESSEGAFARANPAVFASLAIVVAFAPLIVLAGLGRMRLRTLAAWTLVAIMALAGLVTYDLWREPAAEFTRNVRVWPSPQVIFFAAVGLYIAHHLIEPADVEHRLFASYQERFESAWRHGFQLVLSLAFTVVLWGVLRLGGSLFDLIGVEVVSRILAEKWFVATATATAFAAAVHLTDVRPALIRGVRTVGLTLLSWILPLMAGLAGLFLIALVFTGVEPLWSTRRAAGLLLSAAAVLIVLINAVYQDGQEPETRAPVLRWAVRGAALLLIPLVGLAVWASALRIGQYGLTPERVAGVFVLLVAGLYALGYAWAAVAKGPWMQKLEVVNVAAAVAILAAIALLFTPVADPARLAVADQMHRLATGRTKAEAFDFQFLRYDAARFGRPALQRLAASRDPEIARRARVALTQTERRATAEQAEPPLSRATVRTPGATLPESFRRQAFTREDSGFSATCLTGGEACDLYIQDVSGDGAAEVLVSSRSTNLDVFGLGPDGRWRRLGNYANVGCRDANRALSRARPVAPRVLDLEVEGRRLNFIGDERCEPEPRPPTPERPSPPPGGLGPAFNRP